MVVCGYTGHYLHPRHRFRSHLDTIRLVTIGHCHQHRHRVRVGRQRARRDPKSHFGFDRQTPQLRQRKR